MPLNQIVECNRDPHQLKMLNSCLVVVGELPVKARKQALFDLLALLKSAKNFKYAISELLPNIKYLLKPYRPKEKQEIFLRLMKILQRDPNLGQYVLVNIQKIINYLSKFNEKDRFGANILLFDILDRSETNAHRVLTNINVLFEFVKETNKDNPKNIFEMLNKFLEIGPTSHIILSYFKVCIESGFTKARRERIFSEILEEKNPETIMDMFDRLCPI